MERHSHVRIPMKQTDHWQYRRASLPEHVPKLGLKS